MPLAPGALTHSEAHPCLSSLSAGALLVATPPPPPPKSSPALRGIPQRLDNVANGVRDFARPTAYATRCFAERAVGQSRGHSNSESEDAGGEHLAGGLSSAELLFPDDSEGDHDATCASHAEPAGQTASPQTEPASAEARAALKRRRQLFSSCTALNDVVQAELRAEVARDITDGVAAVPPLAPAGWRVLHPTGSSYFTMTRVKHGRYAKSRPRGGGGSAEESCNDSVPRYRSVHDIMTGRSSSPQHTPQQQQHQHQQQKRGPHWLSPHNGGEDNGVRYARSDTHITIFAPFRTLDLTLFDPTVDICEWTRFDVLVRKTKPAMNATASGAAAMSSAISSASFPLSQPLTPLQGQQETWDEGRCIFLRLACANSELRIRSLQFVSNTLARALEKHAVFGKGEPLYLELLRRLRREQTVGRQGRQGDRWYSAVSTLHLFDAPGSAAAAPAGATTLHDPLLSGASGNTSDAVLTSRFDRSGEYARTFAYAGPYLTELSRELREALQEYVMVHLGITNEVAEYVCQMGFFLEQEEYVGWLAQWGQLASKLQQTL